MRSLHAKPLAGYRATRGQAAGCLPGARQSNPDHEPGRKKRQSAGPPLAPVSDKRRGVWFLRNRIWRSGQADRAAASGLNVGLQALQAACDAAEIPGWLLYFAATLSITLGCVCITWPASC